MSRSSSPRLVTFLATIAMLLLPGILHAQDADDRKWLAKCLEEDGGARARHCEVLVESVDSPAATITIDAGRNGGIQYEGWDQDRMEVHARIQAHADTPAEARQRVRAVRLEVTPSGARAVAGAGDRDEDVVVVYRVFVPRSRNLEGTTRNGPLAARGVVGRIRLSTTNGPISLEGVGGDVHARAENGPLSVVLTGSTWRGAGLDAETRNGPVQVTIPRTYAAVLETGTVHGPMSTDIPLVLQPGRAGGRIRSELGGGGSTVRVVTTNGPVTIRSR